MIPTEDKPIAEAEETVIRRAIWSLPKKWVWVGVVIAIGVSYFFGRR